MNTKSKKAQSQSQAAAAEVVKQAQSQSQAAAEAAEATKPVKALTESVAKEVLAATINFGTAVGQVSSTVTRAIFFNGAPKGSVIFTSPKAKVSIAGDIFEASPDSSFIIAAQNLETLLPVIGYLAVKVTVGNLSPANATVAFLLKSLLLETGISISSVTCVKDGKETEVTGDDLSNHINSLIVLGDAFAKAVKESPLFKRKSVTKKAAPVAVVVKAEISFE